jgi:hypothetical protein
MNFLITRCGIKISQDFLHKKKLKKIKQEKTLVLQVDTGFGYEDGRIRLKLEEMKPQEGDLVEIVSSMFRNGLFLSAFTIIMLPVCQLYFRSLLFYILP